MHIVTTELPKQHALLPDNVEQAFMFRVNKAHDFTIMSWKASTSLHHYKRKHQHVKSDTLWLMLLLLS